MTAPNPRQTGDIHRIDFNKASRRAPRSLLFGNDSATAAADRHSVAVEWPDTEKLFSQVFNNSPQPMSITTRAEGRYLHVNESFLSLLGYERQEVIGDTSLNLGLWKNVEQRAELVRLLDSAGRVRNFETELRGKEGQILIWLSSAELIELYDEQCILVVSSDITDRKRAEQSLREVSARLIRAQEEERSRIARELHDGLNQKLALLCVDLERFIDSHRGLDVQRELNAISSKLQEVSSDVHGLSRQLHPSKLDHLGLIPTVKSLCRELSERGRLSIEFICGDRPGALDNLDKDIALCAYRVIQEALTNVIKHAGASRARVEVKRRSQSLWLSVTDSGKGFDVEQAKRKGRLGLISMEERLRLSNGELFIRSRPTRGTQIEARIHLSAKN